MNRDQLKSLVKVIIKETMNYATDAESKRKEVENLVGANNKVSILAPGRSPIAASDDLPAIAIEGNPQSDIKAILIQFEPAGGFTVKGSVKTHNNRLDFENYDWPMVLKILQNRGNLSNESTEPGIGGSYSDQQTTVGGGSQQGERDPLFDPMITGKGQVVEADLKYNFRDFNWMSNMAGFGTPTDVSYGNTYLGTIESSPDGSHYRIVLIDTPKGKQKIKDNKQNMFKSKNQAAEVLHKTWKLIRNEGLYTS